MIISVRLGRILPDFGCPRKMRRAGEKTSIHKILHIYGLSPNITQSASLVPHPGGHVLKTRAQHPPHPEIHSSRLTVNRARYSMRNKEDTIMKRRHFLQTLGLGAAALATPTAFGAEEKSRCKRNVLLYVGSY